MTNLVRSGIYGVDSGAIMVASVFMTKMAWSQGGHIKRRLLYMYLARHTALPREYKYIAKF